MAASGARQLDVAVLGAGGTIAPAIVHDLGLCEEVRSMTLLDIDGERAAAVAVEHGAGRARALALDASDHTALAGALAGADVLVNSASYRLNLVAMEACLKAGCHYLDLGGLYWMTLRQLELSGRFEEAGLLAVLGIGSSPGKTNLMALHGVRQLGGEAVQAIEIAAAGRDPEAAADDRLRIPYALHTLLDELMMEPVVLRDGEPARLAAMSEGGELDYGAPVGAAATIFTLHSELATFGESFGCREASFRLSLAPALLERLRGLVDATEEEVAEAARAAAPQSARTVSVHLAIITAADGERTVVRSVTEPHFGLGGSVMSTAAPAAATVRLMARGELSATGALPPERCIEPRTMFAELAGRGCAISVNDRPFFTPA